MADSPEQGILTLYTPGQILREARESKQLDQVSVSSSLHLSQEIIAAIENDDYGQITSHIYTRGYLRSYAKLVDVDEDSLISLFNESLEHHNEPEIIPQVSQKNQVSSNDKPVKLFTYLISFVLMMLLLVWWQSKYIINDDQSAISDVTEATNEDRDGTVSPAFDYQYTIVHHPDTPESADISQVENTVDTTLQTNTAAETIIRENNPPISGLTGDLKLIISEESWVEVYNVNDRRLYQKLAQPGSIVNVTGLTPLSVLIGNAEGVRVEFNGEYFDAQPFTRANVARLSLGQ